MSYRELKRAAAILGGRLSGSTLQRVAQSEDLKLLLVFRAAGGEQGLLLVCQPEFARLSTAQDVQWVSKTPQIMSFAQYMRAHLRRARFGGLSVADRDRQVTFRLDSSEGPFDLIFSILGSRSNVYLLDREGNIAHAVRPLEETRRDLALGQAWANPPGGIRSEGLDRWESVPDGSYLEAIERDYRHLEEARRTEALARRIENAIAREMAFMDRKAANLLEDLGESRRADEYRRKGELLKGLLHQVRPGAESVEALDYTTNQVVTIPLDSTLTPAENLEAYFSRYQKERRGTSAIEEQLEALDRSRNETRLMTDDLSRLFTSGLPDYDVLDQFASQPKLRRLLARHSPARKPSPAAKSAGSKKEIPGKLLPKRYRTEEGLEIWVGRSDEGNDYLTTRLARGNDLFFHLEGYPGSHVILRTEGRSDPPSESMLAACELAVHFSKMKDAGRAEVHVASVKDVKKPRGAKRGLVYVTRGRTIHLRRNPKRLESILASRLDE